MKQMKKKNPYATTNGKPIKAPNKASTKSPKSDVVSCEVDMRTKVNKR